MPLDQATAEAQVKTLIEQRTAEKERLDKIHDYLHGKQARIVAPPGSPTELTRLSHMSRVNIMEIVVSAVGQSLYVDGYRKAKSDDDEPAWKAWQANRMDARQIGVHRSTLAYGVSYVSVLPGDTQPVIRGYSPRHMVTLYDVDDDDWPAYAMAVDVMGQGLRYRLFDESAIYTFKNSMKDANSALEFVDIKEHKLGFTPVARFLNTVDLDSDLVGEVEPLMKLQDQIDLTTFSLLVAQHYQAFRQRWIVGWVPKSESEALKASASRVWLFDDANVKVGDFEQADLKGYLDSREASLRHAATISQTPVHELIGQLVNLSAEALVAAEAAQRRKVVERQKSYGESWEAVLDTVARIVDPDAKSDVSAEVRWADTESRAFSATVDGLVKIVSLGVPAEMTWERIPGFTQQDVERAKALFQKNNALTSLTEMLDRQISGRKDDGDPKGSRRTAA